MAANLEWRPGFVAVSLADRLSPTSSFPNSIETLSFELVILSNKLLSFLLKN